MESTQTIALKVLRGENTTRKGHSSAVPVAVGKQTLAQNMTDCRENQPCTLALGGFSFYLWRKCSCKPQHLPEKGTSGHSPSWKGAECHGGSIA